VSESPVRGASAVLAFNGLSFILSSYSRSGKPPAL
jgi:hypothetical protein